MFKIVALEYMCKPEGPAVPYTRNLKAAMPQLLNENEGLIKEKA